MSKHHRVVPYLTVKGGIEAIRFYEEAFDAEEISRMMAEDGERVLHAELEINDSTIMLADVFPENFAEFSSPHITGGLSVSLHIDFKKPKHVDETLKQAIVAGAEIIMPAQDVYWGARYAKLRDPFGHIWALNAPLKKKDRDKHNID